MLKFITGRRDVASLRPQIRLLIMQMLVVTVQPQGTTVDTVARGHAIVTDHVPGHAIVTGHVPGLAIVTGTRPHPLRSTAADLMTIGLLARYLGMILFPQWSALEGITHHHPGTLPKDTVIVLRPMKKAEAPDIIGMIDMIDLLNESGGLQAKIVITKEEIKSKTYDMPYNQFPVIEYLFPELVSPCIFEDFCILPIFIGGVLK